MCREIGKSQWSEVERGKSQDGGEKTGAWAAQQLHERSYLTLRLQKIHQKCTSMSNKILVDQIHLKMYDNIIR